MMMLNMMMLNMMMLNMMMTSAELFNQFLSSPSKLSGVESSETLTVRHDQLEPGNNLTMDFKKMFKCSDN